MLKVLRRRWLAATVVLLVVAGGAISFTVWRRSVRTRSHAHPDVPAKPEAPPDLQRLSDAFAAGLAAIERKDGRDAVKHFSSFDFGPRRVEEYRLYYLASSYELAGNAAAARATLARLWRRQPKMIRAREAGLTLASLYASRGDFARSAEVYASVAARAESQQDVIGEARWRAATSRLQEGDVAAALYNARVILIDAPGAKEARDAGALVRAVSGLPPDAPLPLTPSERLARAVALRNANKAQQALDELTLLDRAAPPHLRMEIQLQRGLALHQLRRFEDSNEVLEPLTSGPYKYAIPALRHAARNYAIVSSAINPEVIKTVKERKRVGTVRQRVGKGKKRRTVTRPRYATVFRQVKLIDLAKKKKKDEYDRLASERLKDLLLLPIDDEMRHDVLNALIARATAKNQDAYVMELVPQLIRIDRAADPALQHFWDKGWAAYVRGDLATARKLFRFIADTYTHTNVRRQAEYWYARAIHRQGQKEEAMAIYQKLASAPYEDLYAQHAVSRGAKRTAPAGNPLERRGPDWRELAEKEMPEELQLAYELTALSAMREAALEVRANMRRQNDRFAHALLADIHRSARNYIPMYTSLRRAWPQLATVDQDTVPVYFLRMYYPLEYGDEIEKYAKERGLDPNLVRGLILQESYYNPRAKSRVGATGLMQLMPPTAREHSRKLGIRYSAERLENPEVNIRLGTFHLRMLMDMFRGNAYMAVASYNAGQGNVLKWRRAAPGKPIDEFLESIPFQETRNYVKRVTMLRSSYARLTS